jgi:hypothetical protein
MLVASLGTGYVLGARSGRERYDEVAGKAGELWSNPRVQRQAERAQQLVKAKVGNKSDRGAEVGPDESSDAPAGGSSSAPSSAEPAIVSSGGEGTS